LNVITTRGDVGANNALDEALSYVIREGSTSRESVADSKALLEILNIAINSVSGSREIVTAHDEVV